MQMSWNEGEEIVSRAELMLQFFVAEVRSRGQKHDTSIGQEHLVIDRLYDVPKVGYGVGGAFWKHGFIMRRLRSIVVLLYAMSVRRFIHCRPHSAGPNCVVLPSFLQQYF